MTPKLSLVTGKVERDEPFNRLFRSVIERTTVDYEFIIADASETPFQCKPKNVHVIHEKPRKGHVKGYNAAFRACRGDWVIWLNDDAEVCEGYDVAAIEFMESHPKIGLGALHYSENGSEFHWNSAWGCGYPNFGIFPRTLGEQVDFFDEELTMYGADNSIAIRILLAGYGIADIPNAKIIHHSEKDSIREENQKTRRRDNQTLTSKYMPRRREWTRTFNLHRHFCTADPWSHGVPQAPTFSRPDHERDGELQFLRAYETALATSRGAHES